MDCYLLDQKTFRHYPNEEFLSLDYIFIYSWKKYETQEWEVELNIVFLWKCEHVYSFIGYVEYVPNTFSCNDDIWSFGMSWPPDEFQVHVIDSIEWTMKIVSLFYGIDSFFMFHWNWIWFERSYWIYWDMFFKLNKKQQRKILFL